MEDMANLHCMLCNNFVHIARTTIFNIFIKCFMQFLLQCFLSFLTLICSCIVELCFQFFVQLHVQVALFVPHLNVDHTHCPFLHSANGPLEFVLVCNFLVNGRQTYLWQLEINTLTMTQSMINLKFVAQMFPLKFGLSLHGTIPHFDSWNSTHRFQLVLAQSSMLYMLHLSNL